MATTVLTTQERHQLIAVLQELDPSAPAEKRRTMRRKILMSQWIRRIGRFNGRGVFKAVIVNVSAKGVGFLCRGAFGRGDKFVLPLRFRENTTKTRTKGPVGVSSVGGSAGGGWLVLCEVRNCRKLEDGQYQVGAQFIDRIEDPSGNSDIPGDWIL